MLTEGKTHDGPWDPKRLKELTGTLSFLVVADENAVITLLAHGLLPIAQINVRSLTEPTVNCRILSASINAQARFLVIVMETSPSSDFNNSVVSVITFDTKLYYSRSEELEVLSLKYGQISSHLTYLDRTFAAMSRPGRTFYFRLIQNWRSTRTVWAQTQVFLKSFLYCLHVVLLVLNCKCCW